MTGRHLLIRADASPKIGFGHVSRCLALAEFWRTCGGEVTLLTREPSSGVRERANRMGIELTELRSEPGSSQDAIETANVPAAWTILDGYNFNADFQRQIKDAGKRLLVFDDCGLLESYSADFILNQNIGANAAMYRDRAPETRLLLGSRYTQIRGELLRSRQPPRPVPETVNRILITTGGADPANVTSAILEQLSAFQVIAIIGPENPNFEQLRERFPGVEFLRNPPNIAEVMSQADLALTAAGATAWELSFLGVPFVVIAIAENQRSNAELLDRFGAGRLASISGAGAELATLAGDGEARRKMVSVQRMLFDGRGSLRTWLRLNEESLRLRPATESDARLIWRWANDPGARAASFAQEPIPWDNHVAWFQKKIRDSNCHLWIAELTEPIGQIRFDIEGDESVLSVSLDSRFRGKNLGTLLVAAAVRKFLAETGVDLIHAHVRPENNASARLFEKADFRRAGETTVKGQRALHFSFDRANLEL